MPTDPGFPPMPLSPPALTPSAPPLHIHRHRGHAIVETTIRGLQAAPTTHPDHPARSGTPPSLATSTMRPVLVAPPRLQQDHHPNHPNHPNLEALPPLPALPTATQPLPCPPGTSSNPPPRLGCLHTALPPSLSLLPPHAPNHPMRPPQPRQKSHDPKPPPTPNTCITTYQAITKGSMSRDSTLQAHLLPTIHHHYSHLHHAHHTTTPPPPGPPDRHCGGVAPCTTHPSHHLTSLGPSVTSVPSLRPLAPALALLSRGQGRGVACGWAQEIADQLTWRPKFAPKSVFWVVLEATSVFSMHQLPNIAPSWAPFGSSLVALNFFRQNSHLTCILQ